nr:hypothetical protein [Tanacetum cinerariifolium]
MRTRSQSRENFPRQEASSAIVEPLRIENPFLEDQFQEDTKDLPVVTMTDNCTMAEMLRAPTEGYAEAIVVHPILAEQFELKHSLINMMTSEQFFGLVKDNPHDHIRAARRWLEKEPPRPITTWEDLVSKFINEFFPPSRTTSLRNEISFLNKNSLNIFYNALNSTDQDSLNAAAGGNLLERSTQDVLTIIENKSKVRNSRSKSIASQVKACDTNSSYEIAKLTHAVNEQTSAMTTAMTAMLRQFQATPPSAPVKAVKETCVTCGGAHLYYQCLAVDSNTFLELWDNIQEYVSVAAVQYNQGNPGYRPPGMANQTRPLGSGSLPSSTVANPKGELKAITTCSGLVTDGPTISAPPKSFIPEVDKRVEETFTDSNLAEYTIKVPPPLVPKYNPPSQREFIVHQRDPLHLNILYPLRMLKQKQQEKDEVQIQIFWQMFKQLHVNVTLPDALILMPKYKKNAQSSLSNKEKLQELANTPLNENCSASPPYLGRPFLRTARALIDVHGEEMILHDSDERLTLNMKHDTASYSNHPQRESANLINSFNVSSEHFLEVLVSNQQNIDAFNDIHPHFNDDPLSGSTTYSANSLLKEFTNELALITHPHDYDDNLEFDIKFDLKRIEFLLYQGKDSSLKDLSSQMDLANLDDYFVDPIPEMFTEEHAPDYSSPPKFDVYLDDFLENESYADNFYDDPFDSEGEKIKESKLLMDELDLPCDSLPYSESDSFNSQDFSKVTIITRVAMEKKLAISYASLVFKDFEPPFCEPLFFKDVPKSRMLLPFSSENKEKVFKPGIHTSGKDCPDCEVFHAL